MFLYSIANITFKIFEIERHEITFNLKFAEDVFDDDEAMEKIIAEKMIIFL
jgi:small-conductance mechanosensitive channel